MCQRVSWIGDEKLLLLKSGAPVVLLPFVMSNRVDSDRAFRFIVVVEKIVWITLETEDSNILADRLKSSGILRYGIQR